MKVIKNILIALFLFFCAVSISWGANPYIKYTDLIVAPSDGGENNKGAYVTIFGLNFGAERGTSTVTVNAGEVDTYTSWSDTKVVVELGSAVSTGNLILTTTEGASNAISFTVNDDMDIIFIDDDGNDSTGDGSAATPWKTWSKARDNMSGDICYIRAGDYHDDDENSSGRVLYVSSSYAFGGAGDSTSPNCFIGYPGETVTITGGDGDDIGNYVSDSESSINNSSHIVFANFTIDGEDTYEMNFGWRGVANGAEEQPNRVHDIRVVNLEICNYKNNGSCGGTSLIHAGGDGPIDDMKVLGCRLYDMDTDTRLDHGLYAPAGGNNFEFAWNEIYNIKCISDDSCADDNAGFGLQIYRGSDSDYADFNNVSIHDNIIHDCPSRGGVNLSDYAKTVDFYNNFIYGCGTDGTETGYGLRISIDASAGKGTHYIYNNIFYNNGEVNAEGNSSQLGFSDGDVNHLYIRNNIIQSVANQNYLNMGLSSELYTSSNNCWYGNGNEPEEVDGELNSDPLMNNEANADFTLASGSPCFDAGYDTSAKVSLDYLGISRPQNSVVDVGAYEAAVGGETPPPQESSGNWGGFLMGGCNFQ